MEVRVFLKIVKLLEKVERLTPKDEAELDTFLALKPLLLQIREVLGQPELPLKEVKSARSLQRQ